MKRGRGGEREVGTEREGGRKEEEGEWERRRGGNGEIRRKSYHVINI